MDFLNSKIKTLYFRYLASAFGSALITSIYSIVDMAMVGQYHGPAGTAALAVVAPVWNLIYSLGLLMGIGGSVLFGISRGKAGGQTGQSNEYFTASVIGSAILSAAAWLTILLFDRPLLLFFGADASTLGLAMDYILPVKFVIPCFLFTQTLAAYLRNDGNPGLATAAVLTGGIFNIFGDYFFVFACDMGAMGAGLATAIGSVISILVMLSHFFSRKNTLRLVRPTGLLHKFRMILVTGFSTFFIDIAMGVLTILFNRQIMAYLGTDALSVYGVIVNISTFVQCCAYSVGQASQPIISANFGAGKGSRIRQTLKYALATAALFGLVWTGLSLSIPNRFIRIFMSPTQEVLQVAPAIIRTYGLSFLLLPLNIFSTYYFQAIVKPQAAFIVSVARGLVISGFLILLLPALAAPEAIWAAMPLTELMTAVYVVCMTVRYTGQLKDYAQ
ncbi:MAG TPA: multidrug transporter MatE [Candidatus Eisenbergiella merdavium]|uniref:Multidrug transporter MatE n=1 Tax=Candidatus Eisenbergiella merdavium TaxID=2838551 RepID=A0A9D2NG11_9FIRM|nr:multidrug transporter MatE [Candidatus Eisenbergiella merdavium]